MVDKPIVITKHLVETRIVTVPVGGTGVVTRVVEPYITIPVNIQQTTTSTTSTITTAKKTTTTSQHGVRTTENIVETGGSAYAATQTGPGTAGSGGVDTKTTVGYWKTTLQGLLETLTFKLKELRDKGYGPVDKIYGEVESLIGKTKELLGMLKDKKDSDVLSPDTLEKLRSFYKEAETVTAEVDNLPSLKNPDIQVDIDQDDVNDPDSAVLRAVGVWLTRKPVIEHYRSLAKYLLAAITGYAGYLTEDTYSMLRKTIMDVLTSLTELENLVESGHFDLHDPTSLNVLNKAINDVAALQTIYNKFLPRLADGSSNELVREALMGDREAWEKLYEKVYKCTGGSSVPSVLEKCLPSGLSPDQFWALKAVYDNLGKDPKDMKPGPAAKIRWGLDKVAKYVYFPLTLGSEAAQYLYSLAAKTRDNPALSTAYEVLGLLAQAGGALATGVEAGVIGALTGGVGLVVFAGLGLADLANQIAYYFTDPTVHDAVEKLVEDAKNGRLSPQEYGMIVGTIVTLAAMPLGDKLVRLRLGGKLSLYDKIVDAKKLVYGKIADRLYKAIEALKDKHPNLASKLSKLYWKALEKSAYRVSVARLVGGEKPEEAVLLARPEIDENGDLVIRLLVVEKGRILGRYELEPLDTRFATQIYREGKNPFDVELAITRRIVKALDGKADMEQINRAVNYVVKTLNELGGNPGTVKDALAMIDDIVKGRIRVGVVTRADYRADYLVVGGKKSGRLFLLPEKGKPLSAMYVIERGENGEGIGHIRFAGGMENVPRDVFDRLLLQLTESDAFKDVHLVDVETPNQNTVVMYRSGKRWSFLGEKGAVSIGESGDLDVKIGDAVFRADGLMRNVYVVSRDGRYASILAGKIVFRGKAGTRVFGEMLRLGVDPETGAGFQRLLSEGFRDALRELGSGKDPGTVVRDVYNELFKGLGDLGLDEEAADTLSQGLAQKLVQLARALGEERGEKAVPVGIVSADPSSGAVSVQLRVVVPASSAGQAVKAMDKDVAEKMVVRALEESESPTLKAVVRELSKEAGLPENVARELVEAVVSKAVEVPVYRVEAAVRGGVVSETVSRTVEKLLPPETLSLKIPVVERKTMLYHTMEKPGEAIGVTREVEVQAPATAEEERLDIPVVERDTYITRTIKKGGVVHETTSRGMVLEADITKKYKIPVVERKTYIQRIIENQDVIPVTRTREMETLIPITRDGVVAEIVKPVTLTITVPVLKTVYVEASKQKMVSREVSPPSRGAAIPAPPLIVAPPPGAQPVGGGGAVGGEGTEQYEVVQI